ncbi:hypothetical protein ACFL2R_03670 [Patescibacteria group bacterium]
MNKIKNLLNKLRGCFSKKSGWIIFLTIVFVLMCAVEYLQLKNLAFSQLIFSYEPSISVNSIVSFFKNMLSVELGELLIVFVIFLERIFSLGSQSVFIFVGFVIILIALVAIISLLFSYILKNKNKTVKITGYFASLIFGALVSLAIMISIILGVSSEISRDAKEKISRLPVELINNKELSEKGVVSGVGEIINTLKDDEQKTITRISESLGKEELVDIYYTKTKSDKINFVDAVAVSIIVSEFPSVVEKVDVDFMLYDDGELAIYNFDKNDLELIMPIIATRLISNDFSRYNISLNRLPGFYVLNEELFGEKQKQKEEEYKNELKEFIAEIDAYIREANSAIVHNESIIAQAREGKKDLGNAEEKYVEDLEDDYDNYCRGYYKNHSDCRKLKKQIKENKAIISSQRRELEKAEAQAISYNATIYINRSLALEQIKEVKIVLEAVENNPVKPEYLLGVFFGGDNEIYIKWVDNESEDFSFYLSTVVHEYAHALTFNENTEWSVFLEESMTELAATKIMIPLVGAEKAVSDLGYVDELRVLEIAFEYFSQDELEKLYFTDKSADKFFEIFAEVVEDETVLEDLNKKIESLSFVPLDDRESREALLESIESILAEFVDDTKNKNE